MAYIQKYEKVVYFLWSHKDHLVKVGSTANLNTRITTIAKQENAEVDLLGIMSGYEWHEKNIHRQFKHLRVRGEWFLPYVDLMEYIWANVEPCPYKSRSFSKEPRVLPSLDVIQAGLVDVSRLYSIQQLSKLLGRNRRDVSLLSKIHRLGSHVGKTIVLTHREVLGLLDILRDFDKASERLAPKKKEPVARAS
jgi:hypothetical protein